ncbi:apolipoprotein N-acyltransferase [Vreelandella aquamarina]|jgi:apolipoprotein N-acyltransferase|uniref:Apolipoprotein N-acyltransferase n=2 Tax=Gammaproteobacteria TaxID=1236 RepID=A0A1N6CTS8_9GAMM|nr:MULTISPECIES: apolipoprotein N-acyltransferase [Halomonas]HAO02207.1 apolipoprotein N-acyltransferase [Halomonas sp.]SIN61961.1 Apolipoprotein N-acyltransferase [Halomonas meridiana]SIN71486.1 Apolipoprotein N-acyltransferase [Halomonas meridiana]SIO23401.1 Apolipoprotein N-acyltransferase [Halomonas meridiana]BCB73450.1 apolipoprotein N-acyltransferase [Halomonas meridiana]|tara:strand:- start:4198 stop:5655 length:1458 start_codon:yes stop_codon:yes gene_type:complete
MGFTPTLTFQLLAALVAGGFTTLTASPFELWWLGPVAIGLLYVGLHTLSPGQAALKGWLYGVALFASGTSWVYVSIHDYGYTGVPLAVFLTALFVSVLALFFAGTFWLYRRFIGPRWALLTFAGAWVLGEVLRTYLFTGFPWLLVGSSYVDSPLASWAPVGGVYLLSLLVVLTGTLGAELLRRQWWAALPLAAIWLAPVVLPSQWTTPVREPTRVALLQGNLPQLLKWTPEGQRTAANIYSDLTREVADEADLILWPETALPMIDSQARPVLERVQANLPPEAALLTGIVQLDENNRYFNSVIGVGDVEGSYQKEHLVPFGEYLPLESLLRGTIDFFDLPMSSFSKGASEQVPMQAAGVAIGNAICYEIIYPQLVAQRAADSGVIVTVSNDTWFGASIGPHQHLQMARLRALENGRYVVRATSNGITAIINPRGELVDRAPQFETTYLTGEFYAMEGLTPFTRMGSLPIWLLAGLFLLPGFVRRR